VTAQAGQRQCGQPGLDVGGDGIGWLVGVDRDQDATFGIVGDELTRGLREHPEPVPDHVGLVVGASALARAVKQPTRQHFLRRVQVDRRVQRHAEPGREFGRGGGLRQGPREAVQDVPAGGGRVDDRRGQHVEHDLVGDEVTAGLVGRDLTAEPVPGQGLGAQQVAGRDVPDAGPGRQPLALGALAGARRSEQQQPHRAARSAGMTISRLRILPVPPFGSASTIHTCRGYLYAATWPLT
jgi:hypothetical protein